MEKQSFFKTVAGKWIAVLLALLVLGGAAFGIVKLLDKGENVLKGSWQYYAKITSSGDIDSVFHFAEDGAFYLQSIHATNYGTYKILDGGTEGSFLTSIMGDEIMYDYVLEGDLLTISTLEGYRMELHRIN